MNDVPLREYVESIFHEHQTALLMAESEREKAASALRQAMERLIVEGDERLREHITNQFAQIAAALASSEKLEVERIARVQNAVTERINAVQRELTQALAAAETAVLKAEESDKDRFAAHNGLIAQMRAQAEVSEASMNKLASNLLPRETFEAVVGGWNTWRTTVDTQLAKHSGQSEGTRQAIRERHAGISTTTEILVVVLMIIGMLVTVIVATHGFTR